MAQFNRERVKECLHSIISSPGERSVYRFVAELVEINLDLPSSLVQVEPNGSATSKPDLLVLRGENDFRTPYLVGDGKTASLGTPAALRRAYDSKTKYFDDFPDHEFFLLWDHAHMYVWKRGARFDCRMEEASWANEKEVCRVLQSLLPSDRTLSAYYFHTARDAIKTTLGESIEGWANKDSALQYLLAALWVSVFEDNSRPNLGSALALSDWGLGGERFDPLKKALEEDPAVRRAFDKCAERVIPRVFEWDSCVRALDFNAKKYLDLKRVLELDPAVGPAADIVDGIFDPFCGPGAILAFTVNRYIKEESERGALSPAASFRAVDELRRALQGLLGSDPNPEHIVLTKVLLLQEVRRYLGSMFVLRDMLGILKDTVICEETPTYVESKVLATVLPDRPVSRSKTDTASERQGMANQSVVLVSDLMNRSKSKKFVVHVRKSFLGTAVTGNKIRKSLESMIRVRTENPLINSLTLWWVAGQVASERPIVLSTGQAAIDRDQVFRVDGSPLPSEVFAKFCVKPEADKGETFCQPYISWEGGAEATSRLLSEPGENCYPQYGSGDSPLFGFDPDHPLAYVPRDFLERKRRRPNPLYPEEIHTKIHKYGVVPDVDDHGFFFKGSGNILGVQPDGVRAVPIDASRMFVFSRTRNPFLVITPHPQALVNNDYLSIKLKISFPLPMLAQSRISQVLFRLNSSASKNNSYTWTKQSFAWITEKVLLIAEELVNVEQRFRQALDPLKQLAEGLRTESRITDFDRTLKFTGINEQVRKKCRRTDNHLIISTVGGGEVSVTGSNRSLDLIQLALSLQRATLRLGDLLVPNVPAGFAVSYPELRSSCLRKTAAIRDDLDILVSEVLEISEDEREDMLCVNRDCEEDSGLIPAWWGLPSL